MSFGPVGLLLFEEVEPCDRDRPAASTLRSVPGNKPCARGKLEKIVSSLWGIVVGTA